MVHPTQASHVKALMRSSADGINLRSILILVVSIYIFGNMSEYLRKRLSKIHICENKRLSMVVTRASLLNVYGDEFHFVDKILLK